MIIIPGEIITLATFPGVIIHESAHRFFCDLFRVPVYEVCYYTPLSTTSGYVIHHPTESLKANFFIALGPLFINSIICIVFTVPLMVMSKCTAGIYLGSYLEVFLFWIGVSSGIYALPSHIDIDYLMERFKKDLPERFVFIFPIIFLYILKLANYVSIFWMFYVIFIVFFPPIVLLTLI